MQLLNFKASPF